MHAFGVHWSALGTGVLRTAWHSQFQLCTVCTLGNAYMREQPLHGCRACRTAKILLGRNVMTAIILAVGSKLTPHSLTRQRALSVSYGPTPPRIKQVTTPPNQAIACEHLMYWPPRRAALWLCGAQMWGSTLSSTVDDVWIDFEQRSGYRLNVELDFDVRAAQWLWLWGSRAQL